MTEKYPVKTMSKTNLAGFFNIHINTLMRWINRNDNLTVALARTGYRPTQVKFTPLQVALIYEHLGVDISEMDIDGLPMGTMLKSELARVFCLNEKTLMAWINQYTELVIKLKAIGYSDNDKILSPKAVDLIFQYLHVPSIIKQLST